jgi:HK97 family phage prohead protease
MPIPKYNESSKAITGKKEFLGVKFKVEKAAADENTGIVEGLASVFGNIDQGFDVVEQGAFAKTLQEQNGVVPILLDHSPCDPAGYNKEAQETDLGLYVKGECKLYDPKVKQRYELAKLSLDLKRPMGLSIGYTAVKAEFQKVLRDGQEIFVRVLKEVRLWEYSWVMFPMNEQATFTGAKAAAWSGLFALLQSGRYDLDRVQKALEALDRDAGQAQAAKEETDPEFLQSVDRLRRSMLGQ